MALAVRTFATLAVVAGLLAPGADAKAAAPFGLAVGAVVLSASNCKFRSGAGSVLPFGAINPASLTNATASVTLVIRCQGSAATASYAVTANDGLYGTGPGQPRMRHAVTPTEFLPYTLNTPLSGTTPKGADTNVVITGTITPAQFQNALAGAFSDTVVLTLLP